MKIDQLLVHFLLKKKQFTLQGIGTLRLETQIQENTDPEKPIVIPENAISFEYQPRAVEDEDLVQYISEQTGKIRPLASADLDSFTMLGRQFLNIGKSLYLPHIGTIEKTREGNLIFKGGEQTLEKVEHERPKIEIEEIDTSEENLFHEFPQERKTRNGKSILYIILLIIIVLIGWAIWKYGIHGNRDKGETMESTGIYTDSSVAGQSAEDTGAQPDSISTQSSSDTMGFRVIVGTYNGFAAGQRRLNELISYNRKVTMFTRDSVHYLIAEDYDLPLSDTARIMSSLRRYYESAYLEKQNN